MSNLHKIFLFAQSVHSCRVALLNLPEKTVGRVNDKTLKIPIPAASYRALRNFAPSGAGFV
jgi:hypothetical protein